MHPRRSAGSWSSGVCLAAFGAALAIAAEPVAPPPPAFPFTLADLSFGVHVSGEKVTGDDLKHHVVVVAFWTMQRKGGRTDMPLLEQAHRSLASAGLRVVGLHVDRGAPPEVRRAALDLGLTFPIFDGGSVKGMGTATPPDVMLFDHTGTCIARGAPAEIAARVGAAIQAAPPVVLAGRRLDKLSALERMLRDEAKFGTVLRKAEELSGDEDAATADEATYLAARLRAHGEALLAKAEAVKADDAPEAAALLQRVATAYRGDTLGKQAADWQREWRRDKAYGAGLRAADLLRELEAIRAQALARPAGNRPQRGGGAAVAGIKAAAGIPPPIKAQMAQIAALILQLSPGSKYAARAEQVVLELGLQVPVSP